MIYILSGVETINKGAELMLYAILQEIRKKDPDATVYLPTARMPGGLQSVRTSLDIRELPHHGLVSAVARMRITGALNRIGLWSDFLNEVKPVPGADFFLDASGLLFSDQVDFPRPTIRYWERILELYHRQGTRIIFLPQAFGPLEKEATRQAVRALDRNADLIFARDAVSAGHLKGFLEHPQKLHTFRDFTTLVQGEGRDDFKPLEGKVCIIPNYQMVRKGVMSQEAYVSFLATLADALEAAGHGCFFLDHENDAPRVLADSRISGRHTIITGLNALEIKHVIGGSSLCITSRFHGAVSALNCAVPCLATSWNHKYQELLSGFGQENCLLPVDHPEQSIEMALSMLEEPRHGETIRCLQKKADALRQENREMWNLVWSLK